MGNVDMLNSKYESIAGHQIHYWEGGSGYPVLMLHGVGAGTSSLGNYGPVLEALSERCHIYAPDLIGFGESERKRTRPYFDFEIWMLQATEIIDKFMPSGECGLIGHSLGGALALKTASYNPKITRVLTSSTIGSAYKFNDSLDKIWTFPKSKDDLRTSMAYMVSNPAALTEEMLDRRWNLLQADGYADYFEDMFAPPRQRFIDQAVLTETELAAIKAKTVMLHGRDDRPCPPDLTTMVIASSLNDADVHLLGNCGHNLPSERTDDYLAIALDLFSREGS